jgi:hypothetical protein
MISSGIRPPNEFILRTCFVVRLTQTGHPLRTVADATRWPAWHARIRVGLRGCFLGFYVKESRAWSLMRRL